MSSGFPSLKVDGDEYGQPVCDRYRRLGASGDQTGIYVRFEPGFGLNVHIGYRLRVSTGTGTLHHGPWEVKDFEQKGMVLGIDGWERLGELVDEWRARQSVEASSSGEGGDQWPEATGASAAEREEVAAHDVDASLVAEAPEGTQPPGLSDGDER